jgi:PAS domain S-box-containing protein
MQPSNDLLQHLSIGVLIVDLEGIIREANQALLTLSGQLELVGKPLSVLIPNDYRDRHHKKVEDAAKFGAPQCMGMERSIPMKHANGLLVPCDIRVTRVQDFFLATVVDQKTSDAHTAQQRQWHQLSKDLICTANLKTGQFEYLNLRWTTTLGWSLRELQGRPFVEFVHPDDLEATTRELTALQDEEHAALQFSNRYMHKDGTWRWLQWSAVSDGKYAYASARDTTEVNDLREQVDRWVALGSGLRLEADASVPVEERHFTFASPEWESLLGWTNEEFCGRPFIQFLHPADVDPSIEVMGDLQTKGYLKTRFINRYRHKEARPDGSPQWVWLEWQALIHELSHTVFATAWDITPYKTLEARQDQWVLELQEANRDLEAFASAASHQLKSPPRTIVGLASAVIEDHGDALDRDTLESLTMIRDDALKMAEVVSALHKFSALRAEDLKDFEEIHLDEMLRKLYHHKKRRDYWEHAVMTWPEDLPVVKGFSSLLYEVFSNLVDNAYKYNASAKKVLTWSWEPVTHDHTRIVLALTDNGLGIDMAAVGKKLFLMFQRVHPDFKVQGHGVGLAMARYVMSKMGESIWAESEGPGHGSTFKVSLSLAQDATQRLPVRGIPAPLPSSEEGELE